MIGAVGGINRVFAAAVSGVRRGAESFGQHAAAIAHQSVVNYEDRVQFSSTGRKLAAQALRAAQEDMPQPSVEQSLVGEVVAKNDLAANVASLRTADETLEKLIRLFGRDR